MDIKSTSNWIENPEVYYKAFHAIYTWRDESPGIGRKVVTSFAMIGCSIWTFVDAISNLVLAILSSPLMLVDVPFSKAFMNRALLMGMATGLNLTYFQKFNFCYKSFTNIFADQQIPRARDIVKSCVSNP